MPFEGGAETATGAEAIRRAERLANETAPLEHEPVVILVKKLLADRLGNSRRGTDERHATADERERDEAAEEAAAGGGAAQRDTEGAP